MRICFVDESGCTGILPNANSDIQPTLAIVGTIVDYARLHQATDELMAIKRRYFPGIAPSGPNYLDAILTEIKGSTVRKRACASGRNARRHAFGYLDAIVELCERLDMKVVGRVWIKGIGSSFDGTSVYTFSTQSIYQFFHDYLARANDIGIVIADSRLKALNAQVAHSIFTQKFKSSGDVFDRIIELPAFSHSDNHAGLQICDTLCSGLITPLAINAYCYGHVTSVHVRPQYAQFRPRYAQRLRHLQHRYQEASGRWRGGLTVSDSIQQRSGGLLFA